MRDTRFFFYCTLHIDQISNLYVWGSRLFQIKMLPSICCYNWKSYICIEDINIDIVALHIWLENCKFKKRIRCVRATRWVPFHRLYEQKKYKYNFIMNLSFWLNRVFVCVCVRLRQRWWPVLSSLFFFFVLLTTRRRRPALFSFVYVSKLHCE